ncbi:hypothetical protein H9Q09_17150 [Aurantimonas sp. DM33-3]|uniref:hypothetical protein n=1 Tax=Aurantimonas sp. DM33-3 TaxID=2766955 RepID=UPI0016525EC5|nr:hypothetical protein [Aurantimonas sp. DM33-3]MBC6717919.1 hypothetical protein [Aurantimonas sp. DM33-3]
MQRPIFLQARPKSPAPPFGVARNIARGAANRKGGGAKRSQITPCCAKSGIDPFAVTCASVIDFSRSSFL